MIVFIPIRTRKIPEKSTIKVGLREFCFKIGYAWGLIVFIVTLKKSSLIIISPWAKSEILQISVITSDKT